MSESQLTPPSVIVVCYRCGFRGEVEIIVAEGKIKWHAHVCPDRDTVDSERKGA